MLSTNEESSTSIPKWRKITAGLTLTSVAILAGMAIAILLSGFALLLFFGLA